MEMNKQSLSVAHILLFISRCTHTNLGMQKNIDTLNQSQEQSSSNNINEIQKRKKNNKKPRTMLLNLVFIPFFRVSMCYSCGRNYTNVNTFGE